MCLWYPRASVCLDLVFGSLLGFFSCIIIFSSFSLRLCLCLALTLCRPFTPNLVLWMLRSVSPPRFLPFEYLGANFFYVFLIFDSATNSMELQPSSMNCLFLLLWWWWLVFHVIHNNFAHWLCCALLFNEENKTLFSSIKNKFKRRERWLNKPKSNRSDYCHNLIYRICAIELHRTKPHNNLKIKETIRESRVINQLCSLH